jgi:hypothetical protein
LSLNHSLKGVKMNPIEEAVRSITVKDCRGNDVSSFDEVAPGRATDPSAPRHKVAVWERPHMDGSSKLIEVFDIPTFEGKISKVFTEKEFAQTLWTKAN